MPTRNVESTTAPSANSTNVEPCSSRAGAKRRSRRRKFGPIWGTLDGLIGAQPYLSRRKQSGLFATIVLRHSAPGSMISKVPRVNCHFACSALFGSSDAAQASPQPRDGRNPFAGAGETPALPEACCGRKSSLQTFTSAFLPEGLVAMTRVREGKKSLHGSSADL